MLVCGLNPSRGIGYIKSRANHSLIIETPIIGSYACIHVNEVAIFKGMLVGFLNISSSSSALYNIDGLYSITKSNALNALHIRIRITYAISWMWGYISRTVNDGPFAELILNIFIIHIKSPFQQMLIFCKPNFAFVRKLKNTCIQFVSGMI